VRDLFLLSLAACGPQWVDAREQPVALAEAVATAKADHTCENVVPRCDASHGMTWEFELDVCGTIRRYTVTDEAYGEVETRCHEPVCHGPSPACRSAMRDTWWPVEAHAPERCDDALIDDGLHVDVDGQLVRVIADGRRVVSASCEDPSFMVSIDGQWFTLCGSLAPAVVDGIAIESGLMVGPGPHDVYAVDLHRGGCVRSRAQAISVRAPVTWKDIVLVE
jgi:hypothetical protein